jgi:hypothetical protein
MVPGAVFWINPPAIYKSPKLVEIISSVDVSLGKPSKHENAAST